jgi:hypothetical protein
MPTGYDDEVEEFAAVYEDAKDTWVAGSLDTNDGEMVLETSLKTSLSRHINSA